MDRNLHPQQREGFLLEEMDGELMLYSVATTTIIALNRSAALIWELCRGQYTVAEIAAALAAAYPESAEGIAQQVEETLAQLEAHGAVELL